MTGTIMPAASCHKQPVTLLTVAVQFSSSKGDKLLMRNDPSTYPRAFTNSVIHVPGLDCGMRFQLANIISSDQMAHAPPPKRASLLGLPAELRDQILRDVFMERVPARIVLDRTRVTKPRFDSSGPKQQIDMYWDAEKRTWRLRPRIASATETYKAYLLPDAQHESQCRLISKAPLTCVCKLLRAEISRFLRLAAVDLVAEVEKFDFGHVQAFLSSLPASRLQDFIVQEDGTSTCSLIINLRRPPGGTLGRSSANLGKWLAFVRSLFAMDCPSPELATGYRIVPDPFSEHISETSSTQSLLQMLYSKHEQRKPGPEKLDLYKLMHAWWARWRVEIHLLHGGSWTRHASPNDLNLVLLRTSA